MSDTVVVGSVCVIESVYVFVAVGSVTLKVELCVAVPETLTLGVALIDFVSLSDSDGVALSVAVGKVAVVDPVAVGSDSEMLCDAVYVSEAVPVGSVTLKLSERVGEADAVAVGRVNVWLADLLIVAEAVAVGSVIDTVSDSLCVCEEVNVVDSVPVGSDIE